MSAKSAPSITRVHTLYRIKSIINYVNELEDAGNKVIDDYSIAIHLINTKLSKPTRRKENDQICRRARDHMETARYMGLLYRHKVDTRKYTHAVTKFGKFLIDKSPESECPANVKEEAVLIDRIMRLKLANATYLQTGGVYSKYRQRPCFTALTIMASSKMTDIFKIAYILSEPDIDPLLSSNKFNNMMNWVNSPSFDKYRKKLNKKDENNIKRDTLPLVDWMVQLGLCKRQESEVEVTNRGLNNLRRYENITPLWWDDLGAYRPAVAASIIISNYLKLVSSVADLRVIVSYKIESDLFTSTISNEIKALGLEKIFFDGSRLIDFSFYYDVPPESWLEVKRIIAQIKHLLSNLQERVDTIINKCEYFAINLLIHENEDDAKKQSQDLERNMNINIALPAAAIINQFQSPYEIITYFALKQIESRELKVLKYQSQLAEFFLNPKWSSIANTNPDILIMNDIVNIIECKSIGEWGVSLSVNKKIIAEIGLYDAYAAAIEKTKIGKKCKAVFSYEGSIEPADLGDINKLLRHEHPRVYIIPYSYLKKYLVNRSLRILLGEFLSRPFNKKEPHILH